MFKQSLGFLALCLLCWTPVKAQKASVSLNFEKTLHEFGEIDKGKSVTVKFPFLNSGKETLRIKDVVASCGCTTAKPERVVYEPGEKGEISVTFDSTRFTGKITKKVTVHTDNKDNPSTTLTISGTVVSEVLSKPQSIFFPKAREGKVSTQEIMVTTNRLPKLEISNIKATPEFLSAEIKRIDDQAVRIIVTADGTKYPEDRARLKGSVQFETNATTQPVITTDITVNIISPIGVHPRYAMFWASAVGKKRQLDIRLVSNDGTPFEIESMKASLDFIEVEKLSDRKDENSVKVILKEDAPEGSFKGKVTIQTTHPEKRKIVIPLRGSVISLSK